MFPGKINRLSASTTKKTAMLIYAIREENKSLTSFFSIAFILAVGQLLENIFQAPGSLFQG